MELFPSRFVSALRWARDCSSMGRVTLVPRQEPRMNILISLLVTVLVIFLVLYLINMLPLDGRAKHIARVIVIVIGIISLLKYIAVF
jgi:hypothetical protein